MLVSEIPPPKSSLLLRLPKELLLAIITEVAVSTSVDQLYPTSLIELSKCCRYLYYLIHHDPWQTTTLWPVAFGARFDTDAIYRRWLHLEMDFQAAIARRCRMLSMCRSFADQPSHRQLELLDRIDWIVIWDMITEHDDQNILHLQSHSVATPCIYAFRRGQIHGDRSRYPVILPILSALVNYDFSIARCLHPNDPTLSVAEELSQFAYNFEADSLISQHMPLRPYQSLTDVDTPQAITHFCPALDPFASAIHLFFVSIFANHPQLHQVIPSWIPIPLFPIRSAMYDVEFLRRYERTLLSTLTNESNQSLTPKNSPLSPQMVPVTTSAVNRYMGTGFGTKNCHVSEARLIEGEWIGYYSFRDPDDDEASVDTNQQTDWFDGPIRLTLAVVPFADETQDVEAQAHIPSSVKRRKLAHGPNTTFPSNHLRTSALTRFEGTGVDNLGSFRILGLVDDTEEGQLTWEKTYVESGERWEYCGKFIFPMGLCGRWGDEEYGGPWWMWKVFDNDAIASPSLPVNKLVRRVSA